MLKSPHQTSTRIWTRRRFMKLAATLPITASLSRFRLLAQSEAKKIKITDIRAMALENIAGNCLIRIDTDSGLTGYGEAGSTGPMARARIETMQAAADRQGPARRSKSTSSSMSSLMHNYMAHIPTISGIDIALWDLAGKILNRSGQHAARRRLPRRDPDVLPRHRPRHARQSLLPRLGAANQADARRLHRLQERHRHEPLDVPSGAIADTLTTAATAQRARAPTRKRREAVGDDIDIAVHCHDELDTPSAIGVAKAVEPMNPLWIEDPLNPPFSRRLDGAPPFHQRVPLLTGEKLELVRGFRPFIDNQAVDIIHPDLAFAGGITGTERSPTSPHSPAPPWRCTTSAHWC